MVLVNLHPAEPARRRLRARRAAFTPAQREHAKAYARAYQKRKRAEDPQAAQAADANRYANGTRRARNLAAGWRHALRKYGLTPETYDELVASQGSRCACCGTDTPGRGHTHWCVDHDHETGKVRGALCHRCNAGIGLLGDTSEAVTKALAYLQRAEARRGSD